VRQLALENDEASILVTGRAGQWTLANAAVAGLPKSTLDEILGGRPVLLALLPDLELVSGERIAAGVYTVHLDGKRRRAQFRGADNAVVGEGSLDVSAAEPSHYRTAKLVDTDINGPKTCASFCVKFCLSLVVNLPGPFDPSIDICIEVVVKI